MFITKFEEREPHRVTNLVPPQSLRIFPHPCLNESCSECIQQYRTAEEQRFGSHCYTQTSLTIGDVWPSKNLDENVMACRELSRQHALERPGRARDAHRAKDLANSILADHEYLKRQCAVYGDKMIQRWKGYKVDKREKVLKEADPHFNPSQWVHIDMQVNSDKYKYRIGRSETKRNHLFFEYVNIEAFRGDSACLLNLLFNRAHYHPEEFVIFDSCQLKLTWLAGDVDLSYSPGCLIMQGTKYGELVHWDKDAAHRWDIIGFPRARLILQAQKALMYLLRQIVDKILHDVDKDSGPIAAQSDQVRSLEFRQSDIRGFSSSYYNEPYSVPLKFDINKLFGIAKTQLEVKKDHLWLLQTDPAYAKYWLGILSEGGLVRDKSLGFNKESLLAADLYAELQSIRLWTEVVLEIEKVKELHDSIRDQIIRGQALPPKYNRALGALEVLLVDYMTKLSSHLSISIVQRPGFSKCKDPKLNYSHDPLDFLLQHLLGKPDTSQIKFSRAMIFRHLENHLRNASKEERARIDPPSHEKRVLKDVEEFEKGDSWLYTEKSSFCDSPDTPKSSGPKIARFFERFSKLPLPSGKKDEDWIKSDEASRQALSDVWESIRAYWKMQLRYLGMSEGNMEIEMRTLSADIDPEYVADITANYGKIRAKMEECREAKANNSSKAPVQIQTNWGGESVTASKIPTTKNTKKKTRPQENAPNSNSAIVDTAQKAVVITNTQEETTPKLRIEVNKKRVFTLLTSMYRDLGDDQDMRNVPWEEFRHSMVEIGFDCTNGGGSAVMFTASSRLGRAEGRKISFHRPHPESHIAPIVLQVWRKRLAKHFGFGNDTFVYKKPENTDSQSDLVSKS
ncbi:hypothetical protein SBOR_5220 [Sclerotinia borealis F-4128]|uniref:Uncharacterized protein n=1 Tax=Sclerotinia borealis (strain F-4128) TaxID=1432307 RepID=W9CCF4_SCLBF|nr:hypothetical protein SBOR_5220 [Sclerotinia borealis F-4128]